MSPSTLLKLPSRDERPAGELQLAVGKLVGHVFNHVIHVTHEAIEEAGCDPDDYNVRAYPFELSRVDGKPVERGVMRSLFSKLRWTTRLP